MVQRVQMAEPVPMVVTPGMMLVQQLPAHVVKLAGNEKAAAGKAQGAVKPAGHVAVNLAEAREAEGVMVRRGNSGRLPVVPTV